MHNKYLVTDEWRIIEDRWRPELHQGSESLFSIGNGFMGQRANFEESYSGQSLQGSYLGGVYYPDKTRVGWWKNGYPEYFAKVLNSVNWIGLKIIIDGIELDLAKAEVLDFYRELNMREGYLKRRFKARIAPEKEIEVEAIRFVSMTRKEIGAISYRFRLLNFTAKVEICPYLDFDVVNHDSNYDEKFWEGMEENVATQKAVILARTRKLDFQVAAAMRYEMYKGQGEPVTLYPEQTTRDKYADNRFTIEVEANRDYTLHKYAAICTSFHFDKKELISKADEIASIARREGFDKLLAEQKADWAQRWEQSDILIEGDAEAQQGIRFNIFHLTQTYTGEDARLNIGPKGYTGEKYGGSTYWDTEAYCLPFYMASAGKEVARNLLIYRYNQLDKAIENAAKLGFTKGAALYPMVTMNGEECHNEWEITFEEIHRNGAIAFAIYNYIRYFGDEKYLAEYGLEVLVAIARFWAQRFNFSEEKQQYVMLGVTGPNEYENNVNNNWYTNYLARWCMQYAAEAYEKVGQMDAAALKRINNKISFRSEELDQWAEITSKVFLPENEKLGIVLQQEGYLDKEQRMADDLPLAERPINQHWSWDRILRSCFIKQADVLQGFYFFEDHFEKETIRRNFDFYEPRTVHESSLSPCVHVVQAAYLDKMDKAYEMYLRTSRLDLDDYNREVHEGLHITSMAGTWMSVVEGFGGMRVREGVLHFAPKLPPHWKSLSFKINFRDAVLKIELDNQEHRITKISGGAIKVVVHGEELSL